MDRRAHGTPVDGPFPAPAGEAPVPRARTRAERLRAPLLTAGVVGGLTLALHLRDPHEAGSWGVCPWLVLTGQYCPGCGGLRAVNDLTNGDVAGALSSNLLLVLAVPVVVLLWLRWTGRAWRDDAPGRPGGSGATASRDRSVLWIGLFAAVTVVFSVLRNLPAGSWLAP